MDSLDADSVQIARFEHAGTVYRLIRPLVVSVEYSDGLWVFYSPEMSLWGYGERREEALRDLHENFAYLWEEIVEADAAILDEKALQVKRALLEMTDTVRAKV
jgi:hypothetical protein